MQGVILTLVTVYSAVHSQNSQQPQSAIGDNDKIDNVLPNENRQINVHIPNSSLSSTCKCVKPPSGPLPCMPYDSRFQAATLNEAMVSFPDLTIDQEEPGQVDTLENMARCTSPECMDCYRDMNQKLHQIGLMQDPFNATAQTLSSRCKKYRFARKDPGVHDWGKHSTFRDEDDDDADSDSSDSDDKNRGYRNRERPFEAPSPPSPPRPRRQTTPTQTIVGERFTLSCTTKGVTTDVSSTVALCSACWVWRRLPSNYSPQYINELICDTDTDCLSGYASCQLGHRAIEVIRNDSGVLTTVALTAGSYCECRAVANSAIQSLVSGTGLPSLPAVTSTAAGRI